MRYPIHSADQYKIGLEHQTEMRIAANRRMRKMTGSELDKEKNPVRKAKQFAGGLNHAPDGTKHLVNAFSGKVDIHFSTS